MKPFDTAWLVLKNFVFEPGKAAGYFNRKTGEVNFNLANPLFHLRHDPSNDAEGFAEELVVPVAEHEHTHALIDEELADAVNQGVLPRDRFRTAHEIGAIALSQQATDPFQATSDASSETRNHPRVVRDWPRDSKITPFVGIDGKGSFQPKPIVSEDLPYEFPERYPEQARQTFHLEEDSE